MNKPVHVARATEGARYMKAKQPSPSQPDPEELLTISAASRILEVSTETLRRWNKTGRLPAQRTGGSSRGIHLFRRADLEALAKERSKRSSG